MGNCTKAALAYGNKTVAKRSEVRQTRVISVQCAHRLEHETHTRKGDAMPATGTTSAKAVAQKAQKDNPEIRLVLEIAQRARDAESKDPPRNIGVANSDLGVVPTTPRVLGLPLKID